MEKDRDRRTSATAAGIRRRAEKVLEVQASEADDSRANDETQRLLHELHVHQIELEMQNAELRKTRDEVEATLEKYTEIFDYAPVGYVNLDRDRVIRTVNLSGASLLNVERSRLIGRRFGQYVSAKCRPDFTAFLDLDFAGQGNEACEVSLLNKGKQPLIVQIEALASASGQECRLALIDITGRRQAESTLREVEERMYRLAENADDAIIMLDDRGVVTFCNSAAERMFGCSVEEISGKDFHRHFIPERHLGAEAKGFAQFSGQGTGPLIGRRTEVTALRKDGTEFSMELSISALKLQGKWHAIGIMRDVTARKQLEVEIQDAREYAENIVETVREPLVVLNSDLRILTANHSFFDTFMVSPEETIGNFIYDLGNRQWDIAKLRVLFEEILPHDTVINGYEVDHDFPGIGRKIMLLNARQIFRENIGSRIILLAMEDITERKQVEERIGEVIRQQQAILDNIPNIAWLKDRYGKYVAVNDPFGKALGLAPHELAGKYVHEIYPPDLALKYEKESSEVMTTGVRTYFEESQTDREGKVHYFEKIETPIFNDTGVVIGIIGISHDITNRKEVEETLRHDSTHDSLTDLYNRSFFDEELDRFAQSRMFPVSVVMADVNGLKAVNDALGHEAGDELIRLAARIILTAFRAEDIVARIGGDEFAVLLPETDAAVAEEAVRRILSSPEIVSGQVSIALGIATAHNRDQLMKTVKLSDERMYRNKTEQKEAALSVARCPS